MHLIDIVLFLLIAALFVVILRAVMKKSASGGCIGCSGCGGSCGCSGCHPQANKKHPVK